MTGLREQKKQAVRDELRAVGLRLIEEQGFDETTAEQIAKEAGVSSRSFFRYFRCKEALLFDVERLGELLERIENPPRRETLITSLRVAAKKLAGEIPHDRRQFRFQLMGEHPSVREYVQQMTSEIEPQIVRAVAYRLGVDPESDRRPLVFAQLVRGLIWSIETIPPREQRRFVDEYFDALVDLVDEGEGGTRAAATG